MAIQFTCSNCRQPIEVDDENAGRTAACPYCRTVVVVPHTSTWEGAVVVAARPANGAEAGLEGLRGGVPAGFPAPPISSERAGLARRYGTGALICGFAALMLLGASIILSRPIAEKYFDTSVRGMSKPEQVQQLQQAMSEAPWLSVLSWAMLGTAVVGVVLAVVSLTQGARGNWRALVTLVFCGGLLLCSCVSTVAMMGVAG